MGQFDPFPCAGKIDRMFADHISSPDRVNTNLSACSLADQPFSSMPCCLVILQRARSRDDFAEPFRRSAGRILFESVMHFDDLGVELRTQDLTRPFGKPEKQIDTDTEIRGQ